MQRREVVHTDGLFREGMVGVNSYEACMEGVLEQRSELE